MTIESCNITRIDDMSEFLICEIGLEDDLELAELFSRLNLWSLSNEEFLPFCIESFIS